jgi:hypothetical protein
VKRPCLYGIVLDHYREKAAFPVYVDQAAVALRVTPLSIAIGHVCPALDATTRTGVENRVKSVVDRNWQPFHDARVAAQRAVDTPDELRRLSQTCGRDA